MKKLLLAIFVISMCSSCFIFKKNEKLGCPTSVSATGAENADAGKKLRKKDRYKGGNKFGY